MSRGSDTREITVEVDAEFITGMGNELRKTDEEIGEFVSRCCRERLQKTDRR